MKIYIYILLLIFTFPFLASADSHEVAVKNIVDAIFEKADKQKIEKNKLRILSVATKQYKVKRTRVEKIKNQELIRLYSEIITALEERIWSMKPKDNVTSSGNTISSSGVISTSTGILIATGSTSVSSAEELRMSQARTEVKNMYNASGGASQSKSFFLRYFASEYGQNSYNYQYASTLEFQKP
jgi:hypothetical protein